MTTNSYTALELEFKNAVVNVLTNPGSTGIPVLKDEFRKRGLSDARMDEIISDVMLGR